MVNTLRGFNVYQSFVRKVLRNNSSLKINKPVKEFSLEDMIAKRKVLARKNDELQGRMRDSISEGKKLLKS